MDPSPLESVPFVALREAQAHATHDHAQHGATPTGEIDWQARYIELRETFNKDLSRARDDYRRLKSKYDLLLISLETLDSNYSNDKRKWRAWKHYLAQSTHRRSPELLAEPNSSACAAPATVVTAGHFRTVQGLCTPTSSPLYPTTLAIVPLPDMELPLQRQLMSQAVISQPIATQEEASQELVPASCESLSLPQGPATAAAPVAALSQSSRPGSEPCAFPVQSFNDVSHYKPQLCASLAGSSSQPADSQDEPMQDASELLDIILAPTTTTVRQSPESTITLSEASQEPLPIVPSKPMMSRLRRNDTIITSAPYVPKTPRRGEPDISTVCATSGAPNPEKKRLGATRSVPEQARSRTVRSREHSTSDADEELSPDHTRNLKRARQSLPGSGWLRRLEEDAPAQPGGQSRAKSVRKSMSAADHTTRKPSNDCKLRKPSDDRSTRKASAEGSVRKDASTSTYTPLMISRSAPRLLHRSAPQHLQKTGWINTRKLPRDDFDFGSSDEELSTPPADEPKRMLLRSKYADAAVKETRDTSFNDLFMPNPALHTEGEGVYLDVVRKRSDRKKMHAGACECCAGYYAECVEEYGGEAREHIDRVSRHRYQFPRAQTPPDYWQMGFPDTQRVEDIKRRADEQKQQRLLETARQAARGDGPFVLRPGMRKELDRLLGKDNPFKTSRG
ncbi:uncharacterized protein L969DRAFT_67090 [Mixia osmundae IAM 14324]|uniref:DNA endonuclease activator Ctp1 C-terminal domain-containing protein n=1 Tax=Mixia osmundae (strain CBS 9802 / IAM 14324 / JCM 22182 / KY 12970) TaxID=764103 RepID=G7E1E5_MIXOS|nr:uncharacterized protein L969DRAFT_67090 [Mixia osmundae IAM 14324]KEI36609.1 hypothetical protein L969DRAFT_67090 [Mixia osmundae IAM 14324]GAA96655.1 hypothetical protein E5Q_03326 [Mixia osmundae IAM 14324]